MESKWKPLSTGLTKRPGDKPTTGLALYKFRAVFQSIMLVMFVKFLICICVVVISCSITWETCCWSSEVYKQEFENLKLLGDKKWPLRFDHFDCRDGAERMGLERAKKKCFKEQWPHVWRFNRLKQAYRDWCHMRKKKTRDGCQSSQTALKLAELYVSASSVCVISHTSSQPLQSCFHSCLATADDCK